MKSLFRTLTLTAALAFAAASAHAGLLGNTVTQCANSVYAGAVTADPTACDASTVQATPGSAVVGPGVEFSIGAGRLLDFGDSSLTLTYDQTGSPSPDLFVFDLGIDISSVTLASLNLLDVTFTFLGDRLGVLVGSPLVVGSVVLNIATGNDVPEPGALALLALGLAGLAFTRRRRRQAQ